MKKGPDLQQCHVPLRVEPQDVLGEEGDGDVALVLAAPPAADVAAAAHDGAVVEHDRAAAVADAVGEDGAGGGSAGVGHAGLQGKELVARLVAPEIK